MSERRLELDLARSQPIPAHWEQAIMACLAKDPAQRPQSAGEIALRVGITTAFPATVLIPTASAPPPIPVSAPLAPATRVSRTKSGPLLAAGLAILTLLGIVVYLFVTRTGSKPIDTAIPLQPPAAHVAPIVTR